MPGKGRKRRQNARRRELARARRQKRNQVSPVARRAQRSRAPLQSAVGMVTAVPRAGLDIVSDAAMRTKQLLTPEG
jgi:hypothetical protein